MSQEQDPILVVGEAAAPVNTLPDMTNAVHHAMIKIASSGKIEQVIEDSISKTIASLVNDQLRQYSDFGKIIEAKVKEALVIDPDKVSFPVYHDVILQAVQRHLDAFMAEQSGEFIAKFMSELLVAPPKEITLTELLKQYVKEVNVDHEYDHQHFQLAIDDADHGYWRVKFGLDEGKYSSRHSRKDYELGVTKEGRIYTLHFGSDKIEKGMFAGPFYTFQRSLVQMYYAGTKIVFNEGTDADNYSTYFGDQDD